MLPDAGESSDSDRVTSSHPHILTSSHPDILTSRHPHIPTSSHPDILTSPDFHVDLLGVLFMIWGALTMLIGASTLALGIAAAALIKSTGRPGAGQFAAGLTAATFTTLAVLALSWGLVHCIVGALLRKRRQWSRLAALVLGAVDLLLLPYGTALGVYSLWTLLRERGKTLFEPAIH